MAFFTDYEHQFQEVPEDGNIETWPFLLASLRLLPFFDILGPTTFAFAKADVSGNIQKLTKKYETDKEKYKTLTDIVEKELEENGGKPDYAVDALLWLKRGLEYIREMIRNTVMSDSGDNNLCPCIQKAYQDNIICLTCYDQWKISFLGLEYIREMIRNTVMSDSGDNNLCPCIQKAYQDTIKKFHPWMLQKIINLAIKAVPYRSDFLQTVGGNKPDQSEEQIIADLKVFESRLGANIDAINTLLQRTGQDPDKKA